MNKINLTPYQKKIARWMLYVIIVAVLAFTGIRYPAPGDIPPFPDPDEVIELGITHFSGMDITGDETDLLVVDQTGSGDIVELKDNGVVVWRIADGGLQSFAGNCIDLDADGDTSLCADTDDQIDIELGGVDAIVLKAWPTSTTVTATVNIQEIQGSSPAWTANTNVVNALDIDIAVGNANTGTHTIRGVMIDGISADAQVTETAIELGSGWDAGLDVNGLKIILDADADTSFHANTDDQVDVEIAGADDFRFTANTFTALSGSTIHANTITETTSDNGVAIDGLTVKDGGLVRQYQAKTTNYSVLATDNGDLLSNGGASGEITFTLPIATAGLNYCFYVSETFTVTLELDDSDRFLHLTNANGDRCQNTGTSGDSVCFVAINTIYWLPLGEIGTWSDIN